MKYLNMKFQLLMTDRKNISKEDSLLDALFYSGENILCLFLNIIKFFISLLNNVGKVWMNRPTMS